MVKILKNICKGLFVLLVAITTAGILSLSTKTTPNTSMKLISSSLFNSLKTENAKKDDKKDEVEKEEKEETEENIEANKEETEEVAKVLEEQKVEQPKEEVKQVVEQPKEQVQQPVPEPTPTPAPEPPKQPETPSVPTPQGGYAPNMEVASTVPVTATYSGLVTAYGPDCYGCGSGQTATGYNVSNGNIYYNHPTYGSIRIVAGDRSILRKVVRITGLNISSEPILAIVLDTGGDIGFNKPKGIILDLLFTSEKSQEVLNFGMQRATVEVLG